MNKNILTLLCLLVVSSCTKHHKRTVVSKSDKSSFNVEAAKSSDTQPQRVIVLPSPEIPKADHLDPIVLESQNEQSKGSRATSDNKIEQLKVIPSNSVISNENKKEISAPSKVEITAEHNEVSDVKKTLVKSPSFTSGCTLIISDNEEIVRKIEFDQNDSAIKNNDRITKIHSALSTEGMTESNLNATSEFTYSLSTITESSEQTPLPLISFYITNNYSDDAKNVFKMVINRSDKHVLVNNISSSVSTPVFCANDAFCGSYELDKNDGTKIHLGLTCKESELTIKTDLKL
jgi:hypothetical protein